MVSPRDFFAETVSDAFEKRRMKTGPLVRTYIVDLLEYYVPTANFFDEIDSSGRQTRKTLAETFLKAQNADPQTRLELLKRLADRSLYISGFFGDSLQRKLVDVDYYADMGGTAYGSLAGFVREENLAEVFRELSRRFLEFADVLTYISSRAAVTNEENIMRLYETYSRTGSNLAREKLIEKGLIAVPIDSHKKEQ
jgi:hypothetical protein